MIKIEKFKERKRGNTLYQLMEGERLIGGARIEERENEIFLKSLTILPDFRRQGYGTMLLNEIKKDVPEKLHKVVGDVFFSPSIGAIALQDFYKKNEFDIDETGFHIVWNK